MSELMLDPGLRVARTKDGRLVLVREVEMAGRTSLKPVGFLTDNMLEKLGVRRTRGHAAPVRQDPFRNARRQLLQRIEQMYRKARDPEYLASRTLGARLIVALNTAAPALQAKLLARRPDLLRYMVAPSEDAQLAAIRVKPSTIRYIKRPREKVQMAAVTRDGDALQYINPKLTTEKVRLAAVANKPFAIRFIAEPSKDVVKLALQGNPEVAKLENVRRSGHTKPKQKEISR